MARKRDGGGLEMNYEVVEALGQIAREKNVDKQLVIETLEAGLQSAAKKKYGPTAEFAVEGGAGLREQRLERARAHDWGARIGELRALAGAALARKRPSPAEGAPV